MTSTKPTTFVALAALALPLALGLGACDPDESTNPPTDDVDPGWTCVEEDGLVRSTGTVTNHSSKASFYLVTVTFSSDGVRLDSATASVDGVESGATAELSASADLSPSGDVSCVVSEVERFKA
jgi:hypothetical protein